MTVTLTWPVTMTLFMDDVPAGTADKAVNAGHHAGDCLRACVATVLELDLADVPHFVQYIEHPAGTDELLWWWALVGFCSTRGWSVRWSEQAPAGWALATGMTERGHQHVVVAHDGEIIHDPHPSRAGLTSVGGWFSLDPLP